MIFSRTDTQLSMKFTGLLHLLLILNVCNIYRILHELSFYINLYETNSRICLLRDAFGEHDYILSDKFD